MGTTVNSDTKIYDTIAQTAYLERMQDVLDVFNAKSGGAIILRSEALEGDFAKSAIYKIGGSIEHRDVNSTSSVEGKKIGTDESVAVKVPWKYGPYLTTEESFKRRARTLDEFYQIVGQDAADATMSGFIEHAFTSLSAAIGANTDMVASGSFAKDHKKVLTKGMRKLGDRRNNIVVFAMDSSTYADLVDDAIDEKIFEETGVVVYGGLPGTMGKPVLVSDKIPENKIFGLQAGAIEIVESQAPGFRSYEDNSQENLAIGYRAEGTFNLKMLGYSWNTNGTSPAPANPTLAQLGTGANWRKYALDNKSTAGVMINLTTDTSGNG